MKIVSSYDEYVDLQRKVKKEVKRPYSNINLMGENLIEMIPDKRVYYDEQNCGIIFYYRENNYYRVGVLIDIEIEMRIKKLDAPLLFRVSYKNGDNNINLGKITQYLTDNGFSMDGVLQQVMASVDWVLSNKNSLQRVIDRLEKNGFVITHGKLEDKNQIEGLIRSEPWIREYHLGYRRPEQIEHDYNAGCYMCAYTPNGDICAVTITVIENGAGDGLAIAADERYRMLGVTSAISYQRFKWLGEQGVKYTFGWLRTDNEVSVRYHKSMGFEFKNRYMQEWILK